MTDPDADSKVTFRQDWRCVSASRRPADMERITKVVMTGSPWKTLIDEGVKEADSAKFVAEINKKVKLETGETNLVLTGLTANDWKLVEMLHSFSNEHFFQSLSISGVSLDIPGVKLFVKAILSQPRVTTVIIERTNQWMSQSCDLLCCALSSANIRTIRLKHCSVGSITVSCNVLTQSKTVTLSFEQGMRSLGDENAALRDDNELKTYLDVFQLKKYSATVVIAHAEENTKQLRHLVASVLTHPLTQTVFLDKYAHPDQSTLVKYIMDLPNIASFRWELTEDLPANWSQALMASWKRVSITYGAGIRVGRIVGPNTLRNY